MRRMVLGACSAVVLAWAAQVCAQPAQGDRFLSNVRQLTFEGRRSGEGYFNPRGDKLIFQSERHPGNPFFQIYILDLTSGDCHRVSPGVGKTTCAYFHPHSDRVLFASSHLDPEAQAKQKAEYARRASSQKRQHYWDYDQHYDIFSSMQDGSDLVRLTDAMGYDAEGDYSPDGKLIVFCSLRDAYPPSKLSDQDRERLQDAADYFGEIYLMNADGSEQRRLTDWPGYDGGPFFTPDGERIVWRHFTPDGMLADVYTMRLDGSDRRRLTDFGAMSWSPFFHASGEYCIFTTNKHGFKNFELYIVDALGAHEPVRVTQTDGFDGLPIFDWQGKRLSWTSNRTPDGAAQLFIGDWDHDAAVQALRASPQRHPMTSPAKPPPRAGKTPAE